MVYLADVKGQEISNHFGARLIALGTTIVLNTGITYIYLGRSHGVVSSMITSLWVALFNLLRSGFRCSKGSGKLGMLAIM